MQHKYTFKDPMFLNIIYTCISI